MCVCVLVHDHSSLPFLSLSLSPSSFPLNPSLPPPLSLPSLPSLSPFPLSLPSLSSLSPFLRHQLLLYPSFILSSNSVANSPVFSQLVFTSHTSSNYTHVTHVITPIKEQQESSTSDLNEISTTVSTGNSFRRISTSCVGVTAESASLPLADTNQVEYRHCQLTALPSYFYNAMEPKVMYLSLYLWRGLDVLVRQTECCCSALCVAVYYLCSFMFYVLCFV